jgi:hypothetical protein
MYPVRALSLYNGWNILLEQKPDVWQAIQNALLAMAPFFLGVQHTSSQMDALGSISKLSLKDLPEVWLDSLYEYIGTGDNYFEVRNRFSNRLGNLDILKNKVLIKLVSEASDANTNLSKLIFVDAPQAARDGYSEVMVLLVPENGVLSLLSDSKESAKYLAFTESKCRKQLEGLLPIPYGSPFVIVFFSYHQKKTGVRARELPILLEEIQAENIIERSLEFAPEYTQAGISILSYFSEVLRQKYPNLNVKVRIEQQGTAVLMHVELPSGVVDTIKEELATYFLVVAGKEKPEALLNNPYHVMALENKLQIANMELRMSHQLNAQLNRDVEGLRESQQRMEETFKEQIAEQGVQIRTLINLASQQTTSHERVQLAQIGHAGVLFKDLLTEAQGSQRTLTAIRSLEHNLMSGITLIDIQDQLSTSLATIHQEKPSLLNHLAGQVESAGFGAVGGYVLDWISKHA